MASFFKDWGCYPPEYNREIHGPYNPTIYYGKRDVLLRDVKLRDFFSWLGRRNKSPRAMSQAISRKFLKYMATWVMPKKPGPAFVYHLFTLYFAVSWLSNYPTYRHFKEHKYH